MKKYNKILSIVIVIGSVFMFINYFSYFIKLIIWSEGLLPYIVSLAVIFLIPLAIILHRRGVLQRLFGVAYPFLRTMYAAGLAFYTVSFILLCSYILACEHNAPEVSELPEQTVVINLGAKVNADSQPGKILRNRLETTYALLSERDDLICIASGGKGSDEPISEAECMKNYLMAKGIDGNRIIIEDASHNTIENIRNTSEILDRMGFEGSLAFVTTNFHLPRVKYLCAKMGIDLGLTYFYSAPDTGKATLYTNLVREYMSYCKLFIFGT